MCHSLSPCFPSHICHIMCGDGGGGNGHVLGHMGLLSCGQNTVNYLPACLPVTLVISRIEKEYKANGSLLRLSRNSYEALPSNYGLGRNMLAGAFAGIAV